MFSLTNKETFFNKIRDLHLVDIKSPKWLPEFDIFLADCYNGGSHAPQKAIEI